MPIELYRSKPFGPVPPERLVFAAGAEVRRLPGAQLGEVKGVAAAGGRRLSIGHLAQHEAAHRLVDRQPSRLQADEVGRAHQAVIEQGLAICDELDLPRREAWLRINRASGAFRRGEYKQSEADLIAGLARVEDLGIATTDFWLFMYLGATYAALDRLAESEDYLGRLEAVAADIEAVKARTMAEVYKGYHWAARARAAYRAGDDAKAEDDLARAFGCAELARRSGEHTMETRAVDEAQQLRAYLDDQIERGELPASGAPSPRVLEIGPEGRWFSVGGDEPVDLSRRSALRKILAALARLRRARPGEPLSVYDTISAGWPDEVLTPDSGARRVYSTINRMRDLGLQDVLVTVDDGYLIEPSWTVVMKA